jgi:hypothetical protein
MQSHRWQRIASLADEAFEDYVAERRMGKQSRATRIAPGRPTSPCLDTYKATELRGKIK